MILSSIQFIVLALMVLFLLSHLSPLCISLPVSPLFPFRSRGVHTPF